MLSFYSPFWIKRGIGATVNSFPAMMYSYGLNSADTSAANLYYDNVIAAVDINTNAPSNVVAYSEIYTSDDLGWYNVHWNETGYILRHGLPVYSWFDDQVYFQGKESVSSAQMKVVWDPRTRQKVDKFTLVDPANAGYTYISNVTETYIWAHNPAGQYAENKGVGPILKRYDKTTKAYIDTIDGNAIAPEPTGTWGLYPLSDNLLIYHTIGYLWNGYIPRLNIIRHNGTNWVHALTINLPDNVQLPWGNEEDTSMTMPWPFQYDPDTDEVWLPVSNPAPSRADVMLQLRGEGANGSATFIDESATWGGNTIAVVGSTQIDTSQSANGASSIKFNGLTDYLSITNSGGAVSFPITDKPLTIQAWIRLSSLPTPGTGATSMQVIVSRRLSDTNRWYLAVADWSGLVKGLIFRSNNFSATAFEVLGPYDFAVDTWYHVCFTRTGTPDYQNKLWVNGVQVGTTVTSSAQIPNVQDPLLVGAMKTPTLSYFFNGHIDDLQLARHCRRFDTFTPPTVLDDFETTVCAIGVNLTTGAITELGSQDGEAWVSYSVLFDRETKKKFVEFEVEMSLSSSKTESGLAEYGADNQYIGTHGREKAVNFQNYKWYGFRLLGEYALGLANDQNSGLFKIGSPAMIPVGSVAVNFNFHSAGNYIISYFDPGSFNVIPPRTRPAPAQPVINRAVPQILDAFTLDEPFQYIGPYDCTMLSLPEIMWFEINYTGRYAGYQISVQGYTSEYNPSIDGLQNNNGLAYAIYDTDGNVKVGGYPAVTRGWSEALSPNGFTIMTPLHTPPGKYYLAVYVNKTAGGQLQYVWQTEDGFMTKGMQNKFFTKIYILARAN